MVADQIFITTKYRMSEIQPLYGVLFHVFWKSDQTQIAQSKYLGCKIKMIMLKYFVCLFVCFIVFFLSQERPGILMVPGKVL